MYNIFLIELQRSVGEIKKYKFNMFFANLSLLVLFYSMIQYISQGNKESTFLLLFCWYFASHGFTIPSWIMEDEIMDGTLISIRQSKTSIVTVLILRSVIQIITDAIKGMPLFVFLCIIGNFNFFPLDAHTIFIIVIMLILTIWTSYNVGFLFCLLTLKYKRLKEFTSIISYTIFFYSGMLNITDSSIITKLLGVIFPFNVLRKMLENIFYMQITYVYFLYIIGMFLFWLVPACISLMLIQRYLISKEYMYHV